MHFFGVLPPKGGGRLIYFGLPRTKTMNKGDKDHTQPATGRTKFTSVSVASTVLLLLPTLLVQQGTKKKPQTTSDQQGRLLVRLLVLSVGWTGSV
jgi:hypothetical protein